MLIWYAIEYYMIRPIWLLLLMLLAPCRALATSHIPQFDMTCESVHAVRLIPSGGEVAVMLQMRPDGARAFHQFTAAHVGKVLAVTLEGKSISQFQCQSPLANGAVLLGPLSSDEGAQWARSACPDKVATKVTDEAQSPAHVRPMAHPERVVSPMFAVSCEIVESMEIWRIPDMRWREESLGGFLYVIRVALTPEAGRALDQFVNTAGYTYFLHGDEVWPRQHIQLQAQGRRIISDTPETDAFFNGVAYLGKRRPHDALETARAICPQKIPRDLFLKDRMGSEVGRKVLGE